MKNTHILNLKKEVPLDIRIEVYKDAIKYLENALKVDEDKYYVGLCILLPCLLWDLDSSFSVAPDSLDWETEDTVIAFPEIKAWLDNYYTSGNFGIENHYKIKIQKRIEFLKETITELEVIKT